MLSSGGMAKPGSGRTKPLTLRQVEALARAHGAGEAWDSLTPAQRKQWAARVNRQHAAEQKALEKQKAAAARKAADDFDRFMDQFWAPVRKEQAALRRRSAGKAGRSRRP